jgi:hypothetical protein
MKTHCVEISTKKVGHILFNEPCGCTAKIEIEYDLGRGVVNKTLCMRHYKSVTSWLSKIKTEHKVINDLRTG